MTLVFRAAFINKKIFIRTASSSSKSRIKQATTHFCCCYIECFRCCLFQIVYENSCRYEYWVSVLFAGYYNNKCFYPNLTCHDILCACKRKEKVRLLKETVKRIKTANVILASDSAESFNRYIMRLKMQLQQLLLSLLLLLLLPSSLAAHLPSEKCKCQQHFPSRAHRYGAALHCSLPRTQRQRRSGKFLRQKKINVEKN